ncbi:MAG TPA: hypothetical protein H9717_06115 [Candidatus Eisenbergiella merdipullorum]|uniref:Uncharacterized protein n=1 Tax=Candidatus Eisenbergiella merdipullorum TaxID=2838553 RepID=A0A9D2I3M3_9FIRM|nr:hypothetical protein [Candidatus Eisenbergiella merdipullorum]
MNDGIFFKSHFVMLLSRKKFGIIAEIGILADATILQRLSGKVNQKETGSGVQIGPSSLTKEENHIMMMIQVS